MVGYAAATTHRGIRLIRIPTTVLAQDDAALGVKNGINVLGRKNFIGTFAPPWAVINDSHFLTSLSDRDWISGVAEALKVALIKDADFFNFIERHADALRNRDMAAMEHVIHCCATLHLHHIATCGDPFEAGNSRPLDFGHWAAHKLEQISAYRLRHGEAVAVGMAIDATYSYLAGLLSETPWRRILETLVRLGFTFHVPELARTDDLLRGLKEFQEHLGGCLTVTLLTDIGKGREVHAMEQELIFRALARLREIECEEYHENR
jgi:3-dehydroquinate synthase